MDLHRSLPGDPEDERLDLVDGLALLLVEAERHHRHMELLVDVRRAFGEVVAEQAHDLAREPLVRSRDLADREHHEVPALELAGRDELGAGPAERVVVDLAQPRSPGGTPGRQSATAHAQHRMLGRHLEGVRRGDRHQPHQFPLERPDAGGVGKVPLW